MTAHLTYNLHRGILIGAIAGKCFNLLTHREQSRIKAWEDALRNERPTRGKSIQDSVSAGGISHKLKIGTGGKLEVYDYPNGSGQRDGQPEPATARPSLHANHLYSGPAIFIEERDGGFYIHGWPPCNIKRCVVVISPLDDLLSSLAEETSLPFEVEF